MNFPIIDSGVFTVYFILTVSFGLVFIKKTEQSSKVYFFANKTLTWEVLDSSEIDTNISAEQSIAHSVHDYIAASWISLIQF